MGRYLLQDSNREAPAVLLIASTTSSGIDRSGQWPALLISTSIGSLHSPAPLIMNPCVSGVISCHFTDQVRGGHMSPSTTHNDRFLGCQSLQLQLPREPLELSGWNIVIWPLRRLDARDLITLFIPCRRSFSFTERLQALSNVA